MVRTIPIATGAATTPSDQPSDNSELARAMRIKPNDQLMAIYISSLIRAITAFHDRLRAFHYPYLFDGVAFGGSIHTVSQTRDWIILSDSGNFKADPAEMMVGSTAVLTSPSSKLPLVGITSALQGLGTTSV